ncbi:MFS transporter [Cohnella pontilimi]|uniref:MFS transporter n=1 Tax=Cohnella pontilimi TaxID=2564100 RepID=A0A4U0FAN4_9BACL|nr:MFS transporter [Cohnella pontilimi]TJY41797.1 MFS transporter [Cohnella pontilimi]
MEMERQGVFATANVERPVWTNARFLILWLGSGLTSLAFSVYLLTEAWFVVQKLDRESWLGVVMMVTTIPRVLLMTFGGVAADRIPRSTILSLVNVSRGIMIFALVALLSYHSLSIWGLLVFALIFGVLDAFFWPANGSLLPQIIGKNQLVRGNSIIQTTNQLCFLLGPALAGLLLKFVSFEVSFAVSALFLLLAGVTIRFLREERLAAAGEKQKFMKELKDGITYVKSFSFLLILMGVSIIINLLFAGPLNAGMPVLVKHSLHGDVLALSYLESSIAVGMMAGSILSGILNLKRKRALIAMGLILLLGAATALLSQITAVWQGIVLMFAIGFFVSFSNILTSALIQQMVRTDMMGRVQGVLSTASMGFIPLSYALVSILLSAGIPIPTLMLVSSVVMVLFVVSIMAKVKVIWTTD